MKLWLLRPVENLPSDRNPWEPWYDKCFGFVICAENEEQARQIAAHEAYDEWGIVWRKSEFSTCEELDSQTKGGLVLAHVRYA